MVTDSNNNILLVNHHKRGWEFPGGFVGDGESNKSAAVREVKEETGIDIQLTKFFGVEQDINKKTIILIFKGTPVGGNLTNSKETKGVDYFNVVEALKIIKLENYKQRITRCLKENDFPFAIKNKDIR